MELKEAIFFRRSVRNYSGEVITDKQLSKVLQAALVAPSSRNFKSAEFITVSGKKALAALAQAKAGGNMLVNASHGIVVIGNSEKSDAWIEDGSIAMTQMMLTATDLGLASCWIHCHNRNSLIPGVSSEDYVKELLGIPTGYSVLAILCLGIAAQPSAPHSPEEADFTKVHNGKF